MAKYRSVYVAGRPATYETGWVFKSTKQSNLGIDARQLATDIASACNELDSQGFEIVSVLPITRGDAIIQNLGTGGAGAGWAYTNGAIVLARSD